jgi:dihydroorotate dehydrogenase
MINSSIQPIVVKPPLMNAAGFGGFHPSRELKLIDNLDVFVTNPISFRPRPPAGNRIFNKIPGGFIMHNGYPNPGFKAVIKKYSGMWKKSKLPIWVDVLTSNPYECRQMVETLEELENVTAVELTLLWEQDWVEIQSLVEACLGELPVYVKIPLNLIAIEKVLQLAAIGVSGITITAPRGFVSDVNGIHSGRIFGPGLLPQVTEAVIRLQEVKTEIIAGAGVFSEENADALAKCGGSGVQFDALLWQI